jgi:phage-related protein
VKVKFFLTSSGRTPVEEFLREQLEELRRDFLDAVCLLTEGAVLTMPLSRNLSRICKGLHELRLRDRSGQVRAFYFIKKADAIYMLHAFRKKRQDLLGREIAIALRRIKEV